MELQNENKKKSQYSLIFLVNMVNLKATIRVRTKNGLYPVYIRFTKGNQVSYVKTSWVVNDKGLDQKKNITDPGKAARIFGISLVVVATLLDIGRDGRCAFLSVDILARGVFVSESYHQLVSTAGNIV